MASLRISPRVPRIVMFRSLMGEKYCSTLNSKTAVDSTNRRTAVVLTESYSVYSLFQESRPRAETTRSDTAKPEIVTGSKPTARAIRMRLTPW